nr:IucA/IucC family siderophore biosynthesis protein [uncultured Actinoplanes sp.]
MPTSQPASRRTADAAQTRDELGRLRPDLVARYDAALPGARAAVLARLLGAIDREPLPAAVPHPAGQGHVPGRRDEPADSQRNESRRPDGRAGATLDVRDLDYPASAAVPFAPGHAGLAVTVHGGTRVDDPGTLVRLLWGDVPFAGEVDNSVANLALARAQAPPATLPHDLGRIEQLVVDGHPLHPCCRTRGGMTVRDVLTYAPEHSPTVRLRRLKVPPDRWFGTAPPLLYAHPWQVEHLRDRYPFLTDDGETAAGRPLMSLRTVALPTAHVKTAVDVQMTSAVRTVSPAAVTNGPLLSALLRELTADLPLSVLAETAGGAVVVDGEPQRHLAYLARRAPATRPGELVVPLAAMASSPLLLRTVEDPYDWWGLLCDRLFAPLVTVLDRGVALEAHGQNTLVVLRDNRPHRVLYRDFGGVRVDRRHERIGLRGDILADDPQELGTKLAASALGNAAAHLIAAFTRHFGTDPAKLWARTAASITNKRLLTDPLPVKATTAMRLSATPLDDIWAYLGNPMAAHA